MDSKMNKMTLECISFFTLLKLLIQGGVNPLCEETDQEYTERKLILPQIKYLD